MAKFRVLIGHRVRADRPLPLHYKREEFEAPTSWDALSAALKACAEMPRDLLVSLTVGRVGDPGVKA